ncbi:MAG: DUF2316 family protein [Micrococcaceae bacterium]
MSLNSAQRATTRTELTKNLNMAELTTANIADDIKIPVSVVNENLNLTTDSNPALVWKIRDYIEKIATNKELETVPYTYLS